MGMNFEEHAQERAVLVGLNADCFTKEQTATDETLEELEALLETAGGFCTGKILQNRHTPDSHSFIGEGKAQEVKMLVEFTQSTMVVFDNELSPGNIRALEEIIGVTVLDRSALILDIFAQRAKTKEGRLQVELAQYKYLLPRLLGMWTHLERQEGAIGTRGPGETQLESDRRHIGRKISKLKEELEAVRKVRGTQRKRREKNAVPMVALVGYTNAGKSTLLNQLTDSDIPANDRLFDTLDTTTRRMKINDREEVLLSDTVGFIRKLPHHLIEAFKSTLEELCFADVLLHVIDLSNPDWEEQAQIVDSLIVQLGAEQTPCLRIFNKCDKYNGELPHGRDCVCVSARTGEGCDALVSKIEQVLDLGKYHAKLLLPYDKGGVVEVLHREAAVSNIEYTPEGIEVELAMKPELWGRVKDYAVWSDVPDLREEWEK